MRRPVRIVSRPKAQSGLDIRMNPGMGFNANQLSWPVMAGEFSQKDIETRGTIQPTDWDNANLEAELGETVVTDLNHDGITEHYKIGGKRHYDGGTPLNLPPDSFIFSRDRSMKIKDPDILKMFGKSPKRGGYTPADLAKTYDINKYRKALADSNSDDLERETAEMMIANYNLKLGKLALAQESLKGFPQGIPAISMPYLENMQMNPEEFLQTQGQQEQPAPDNMAKYGKEIKSKVKITALPNYQKAGPVKYPTGQQQWLSYSGQNDPSKSYLERVASANVFRRDPTASFFEKRTDVVDPRMYEDFEKIIPFYGKEAEGFGDWFKTLVTMPQKEINNLFTGYYENPYATYKRYNKEDLPFVPRVLMQYGTDPMLIDLPYYYAGKVGSKLFQKGLPYAATAAKVVKDASLKYGTKAVDWAAQQALKLYGKITPELLNYALQTSGKIGQVAAHDSEAERTPRMFTPGEREAQLEALKREIQKLDNKSKKAAAPSSIQKKTAQAKTIAKTSQSISEPDFENMSVEEIDSWLEKNK